MPRSFLLYAEVESRAADPRTWQQKWEDAISLYEKNVDPRLQIALSFVDPLWIAGGEAVGAVKATRLAKRADSLADTLRAAEQVEHAEQLLNDVKALSKAGREREAKAAIEAAQRAVTEKPTKILPRSFEELPAEAKKQLASFDPDTAPKLTPFDTPEVMYARELNEFPSTQRMPKAERAAFRDRVTAEYYGEGAAIRDKQAFIVTGLPGSGKSSTVVDRIARATESKVIDIDDLRGFFPEYYGWNSSQVNPEAANILPHVVDKAIKNGDNFVYPIIGDRIDGLRKWRDRLTSSGYDVHLAFVDVSPETAARNVVKRFSETGRFVDPEMPLRIAC